MQNCSKSGIQKKRMCFSTPQSNRPLTGSESRGTKADQFPLSEFAIKILVYINISSDLRFVSNIIRVPSVICVDNGDGGCKITSR